MSESTQPDVSNLEASNENQDEVNENLEKPKKIIINSDLSDKELMRILEAAIFSAGKNIKCRSFNGFISV